MGRSGRKRQKRLPQKLRRIREAFGLSQGEMVKRLGLEKQIIRSNISSYEIGDREPPLYVLLKYARLAGVCLDVIVDDEVALPNNLPARPDHSTSSRQSKGR